MVVRIDGEGRRCDAACYDAKRLGCTCICGGKNHGQGLEKAMANEELLEEQELDEEDPTMTCPECKAIVHLDGGSFPGECPECGAELGPDYA